MPETILLVAGGTGGHVMPAIALSEVLFERGYKVEFVTDKRGERFFSGTNIFPIIVQSGTFPKDLKGRALGIIKIGIGIVQSLETCREHEPKIVIGFGSYTSFPTLFAAQLLKVPTILHEQNAVFGRANRQVAAKAKLIATSFAQTKGIGPKLQEKTVQTGNPVRSVFASKTVSYVPPTLDGPFRIVVTGGSQGAALFGTVVPEAIEKLPPASRARIEIAQQARPEDIDRVREIYKNFGIKAVVQPFFKNIVEMYQKAHLFIGRSGASTVAEIAAIGRPALYVPLAASVDGDQAENARQCVARGAAWQIDEQDLTADALAAKLGELMDRPQELAAVAQKVTEMSDGKAAEKLADLVIKAMQES